MANAQVAQAPNAAQNKSNTKKPEVKPIQQRPIQNKQGQEQQGGRQGNPKQHTMESVQVQPGMTAEQIRRQIEQSVEAKLENRGVNKTSAQLNQMVSQPNAEFLESMQEASAAVEAASKAHENESIMRDGTSDAVSKVVDSTDSLGDESFIKPLTKVAQDFGMDKSSENSSGAHKTLSSQPRAEKPISHNVLQSRVFNKAVQNDASQNDIPDAVPLGTSEKFIGKDGQVYKTPEAASKAAQRMPDTPDVEKVNVYFVPNLGDESELSNDDINMSYIAVHGESKQIISSKFKPVVYLKDEDAAGYDTLDIPGVKVKDGYKQVDALDYAEKNNVTLDDIVANDSDDFKAMSWLAFETQPGFKKAKPECRIARKDYIAGYEINDFAVSERNTTLNVPVIIDSDNNKGPFNAYEYGLASSRFKSFSVDNMLNDAYNTSLAEDRAAYPDIYRDMDAFHDRCVNKSNIIKDKTLDSTSKKQLLKQLDIDFADSQKQYYAENGLSQDSINHLEEIGYIGIDSARFRTHVAYSYNSENTMRDLKNPERDIVKGAGKFTINSDSKDTNFGGFLMQNKDDIMGYIGDKLGISDEESRNHKLYISTPSISQGVSSCVLVYDGIEGYDMDATVREVTKDILREYGDQHATISDKSYAVEQGELDYCKDHYSNNSAQYSVPTYGQNVETVKSKQVQTTLDSSLEAGYDAAQQAYYDNLANEEAMSM